MPRSKRREQKCGDFGYHLSGLPCFLTMNRNPKGVLCLPVWRDSQSEGKSSLGRQALLVWSSLTCQLAYCPPPPTLWHFYYPAGERRSFWETRQGQALRKTGDSRCPFNGPSLQYSSTSPFLLALSLWNINVLKSPYHILNLLP